MSDSSSVSLVTHAALRARSARIGVVGLGYVGLPLAVHLSRVFDVTGFDISQGRIAELGRGHDRTREVDDATLSAANIEFTADAARLRDARLIIVAVPTPIDDDAMPDLRPVRGATATVGDNLAPGSVVVFESTVYPGLTEEVCVPILEERSGLVCGRDFSVGYSPERINPGDKEHTFEKITKVVAGLDAPTLDLLAGVYGDVVVAGVHRAPSIKVAEAAKVIENTQRDLNIALMNELALVFDRLGIDTLDVLEAAGTKWNFLPFKPGLVGGHCIGVDPYYLTYKARRAGYNPEVIHAGRRINDHMGQLVADKTVRLLIEGGGCVRGARVAVLGFTFKENVPDLRNTRVIDVVRALEGWGVDVLVHDPEADEAEAHEEYGIELVDAAALTELDAVVLAVGHRAFDGLVPQVLRDHFAASPAGGAPIVVDVKGYFDPAAMRAAGYTYWRL